jgi:hypothetical protein
MLAKHKAMKNVTIIPRDRGNEFRIILYRYIVGTGTLVDRSNLYFSYSTPFYLWLSILRDETRLNENACMGAGLTLKDGPWVYRLVNQMTVGNLWYCVEDEMSYLDMLENLKKAQGIAFLVHVSFSACLTRLAHFRAVHQPRRVVGVGSTLADSNFA